MNPSQDPTLREILTDTGFEDAADGNLYGGVPTASDFDEEITGDELAALRTTSVGRKRYVAILKARQVKRMEELKRSVK